MVTSDFSTEVEIRPFCAFAMHPAIIIGTVRSLWTCLWGRYHVPQNAFLVDSSIPFHSFIYSFIHSFIHSLIPSIHSVLSCFRFIHSLTSFIHSHFPVVLMFFIVHRKAPHLHGGSRHWHHCSASASDLQGHERYTRDRQLYVNGRSRLLCDTRFTLHFIFTSETNGDKSSTEFSHFCCFRAAT